MRHSFLSRVIIWVYSIVNRFVPWHRLPPLLGAFNLKAIRDVLREKNLHDTAHIPVTKPAGAEPDPAPDPRWRIWRSPSGTFNDLSKPSMGRSAPDPDAGQPDRADPGSRFGRNVPLDRAYPDAGPRLLEPSPRLISNRLLARDKFIPVTRLNLLAAAWIQFQVHDWFAHGTSPTGKEFKIPLEPNDPWPQRPMRIRRTRPDPTRSPNDGPSPPTYVNAGSHWWDASQIYGCNDTMMNRLRRFPDGSAAPTDGKLALQDRQLMLDPETGEELSGFTDNWWTGLSMLHTLFSLEHNEICKRLREEYRCWPDERLFHTARLINVALMAKIHTVEWTPAILNHPCLKLSMPANWWGLAGETITRHFGRLSDSTSISGIPGSPCDHHCADYALTEEFVAVYRMHPLMPDSLELRSLRRGEFVREFRLPELLAAGAREPLKFGSIEDLFYSFGVAHPGAITLHNFPNFLRELHKPKGGETIDLAAVDILRDRERGVPRYNEFRRLLHMPPIRSFDKLTRNRDWAKEMYEVYHGDIERVDTMIGMYAETPPKGFGFSDTAFRVFILMASRRLKSDRFFTDDYGPELYTQVGIDWINDNSMLTVLQRHYPELEPALRGLPNAFVPWHRISRP